MSRWEQLMRLHDDELSPAEADALLASLDEDEFAALEGLEQVGDVLRAVVRLESAVADGVADDIMRRLDEPTEARRNDATPAPPARRSGGVLIALSAGLAAAAAVFIFAGQPHRSQPPVVAMTHSTVELVSPPTRPPAPVVSEPSSTPETELAVAIESIEFGASSGAIFMVSAGEETTPVVWLNDEEAENGDRMESL